MANVLSATPEDESAIDLNQLAQELVDRHRRTTLHLPISIELATAGTAMVAATSRALLRALSNLVENAIEFGPPGGAIQVAVRSRARSAVVEIIDTGPGVPPDLRARVFDPFFTTRPCAAGLGLPVARQIVESLRGRIRLGPPPGCVAIVELPLVRRLH